MNVVELAKQAGLYLDGENAQQPMYVLSPSELGSFATLVRAEVLEEAAGVCEATADRWLRVSNKQMYGVRECAAAIRELKDKT